MTTLRIFVGFDQRSPISAQVLIHSIYTRASCPVSITPLQLSTLPIKRTGLTQFTYSRYLVPWLCDYQGIGVFMDSDMLVLGDVKELFQYRDFPVSVVKHTRKFEWPSLMVFNAELCRTLTPEYIDDTTSNPYSMAWATSIGAIDPAWNHLVGYDEPRPDAKLIHYTGGVPAFKETRGCEYSDEWMRELSECNSTVSWQDLMGNSVHVEMVKNMKRAA